MFIDIHAHAYAAKGAPQFGRRLFATSEELLCRYDELGIERAILLPLVSPEVYEPQSSMEILAISRAHPDRFIPFCNVDPRAMTNSPAAPLAELLGFYRDQGCKGIGEVLPNLEINDPRVQNLLLHVDHLAWPLIVDITGNRHGGYGLIDDPGLPQFERALRCHPNIKFFGHGPAFWAEIGDLRTPADRFGYPKYAFTEEGVVPKLLRRYENLYGDLSAGSGYNALSRNPDYAVQFLTEFQDRMLFATDICAPDTEVPLVPFLLDLRATGKITEEVFRKIARENAIKLLGLEDS